MTLDAGGLEVMLHSKYTSSPSLISDASKFEPKDNPTTGGSVQKESKIEFNTNKLSLW